MKGNRTNRVYIVFFSVLLLLVLPMIILAAGGGHHSGPVPFPPTLEAYNDGHLDSLVDILAHRIGQEPLNLVVTILFFCAILHIRHPPPG